MNKKQGKILVAHHKEFWTLKSSIFEPIHLGKSNSSVNLNMIGDNTGDNISHKNQNYCELTAMYWAWKNLKTDFIGFYHYRRFLNLDEEALKPNQPREVIIKSMTKEVIEKHHLCNDDKIYSLMNEYDLVVPLKYYLSSNIATQYVLHHINEDWKILIEVILEKHSTYNSLINEVFYQQNYIHFYNMFIMNYGIFDIYMKWVFDILFEVEKRVFISQYPYQSRIFGFMAERLFNLFLVIFSRQNSIKIKELPVLLLDL